MSNNILEYLGNLPVDLLNQLPGDILLKNPYQPENRNKLTNNKFLFLINRCPTFTYFCQRANIPELSMGISIQSNPTAIDIKRPGTRHVFGDLAVGFVVDEEMKNWLEIYNWIRDLSNDTNAYSDVLKEHQKVSSALLTVFNSAYKPIIKVNFYNLFPISLTGIDFDSTLPSVDAIVASATFSYTHYEIEGITAA
jgi:hypothetical protein